MRIRILDDLEGVALTAADWTVLGPEADVRALREHLDPDDLAAALAGVEVVVCMRERTPFPRDVIEALPDLRLLVTTGARNGGIDLAACTGRGVTVCGTRPGGSPVVELAWALVLAAARDVPGRVASMREGDWQPRPGRDLAGRTLGLVGLGRTGSRMARIAAAFDMPVLAWSQNLTAEAAAGHGARRVSKRELFAACDIVSLHVLLSERTRGLVGEPELRAMRPDAWLVNTSRGAVCDEEALLRACRDGWIAGAALDVFGVEPLPADHPLRGLTNVLLTPHQGYVTWETYRVWFADAVEDVAAWRAGRPLRELVAAARPAP